MPVAKTPYTPAIVLPSDIGPYRIHERLGAGGMGEVFRAYDRRLERWVAIKVVRPDDGEDPEHHAAALERFRREARAAAGLSHPGIVQIHDILERAEGDCIVMELVEGETLAQVIRRRRLSLGRVVPLAREIAEALSAAHSKGVIHRDLKAENVMITADGRAKILDFGLAKRVGSEIHDVTLSGHGKILGTSHAMSPEQAQGLDIDHRSDLFSFGSLLYELVTGQAPFRRQALAQTLTWVCTRDPTPAHQVVPDCPQLLSGLIEHLLEKDPELRPETAGQVAEVLRHLEHLLADPGDEDGASAALGGRHGMWAGDGTGSGVNTEPTLLALPRPAYADASAGAGGSVTAGRKRRTRWLLAAALVAVLVTAGIAFVAHARGDGIYVAVPTPTVTADDHVPSRDLLPSAARVAVLQELLSLDGVTTLAPDQVDAVRSASSVDLARALAADEVIMARLDCHGSSCRATLSRIRGTDGALLWTQIFEVPSDDLLRLSDGMGNRIRQAYADRNLRSRGGSDRLDVKGPDYEAYLRVREAFRTRLENADLGQLLERLATIRRSSPRFVPAYLLEAQIARTRFSEETRQPEDLNRAYDAIQQARSLVPHDPQPLFALVDTALAADQFDRADEALEELESLEPGGVQVQIQRAIVLVHRGRAAEGLRLMRSAVEQRPSEQNLIRLAKIEVQQGEMEPARKHLTDLLERAPDSFVGRALLAQIELVGGSPARAAELYRELVRRSPNSPMWTNLGLAYLLQARYDAASDAFSRVLEAEDDPPPFAVLNLADAELLSGRTERAEALYHQVLDRTAADPGGTGWQILTIRAQALAHLDRSTEAVALTQRALQAAPDNSQAAFEAALVYSLAGERRSALVNSERALRLGYAPVWFRFPWFDSIRDDPELAPLLGAASRS